VNKIATVLGTGIEHGSRKKCGTGVEHVTLISKKIKCSSSMFCSKFCISSDLK